MNLKKNLENHLRGWLPKEPMLAMHQRIKMTDNMMRLQLLRLIYGLMLGALLFTPFGVYHSRSEPYIIGSLWGYQLPIGYVGLLLGIVGVLYPKLGKLKSLRFSSLMIFVGFSLLFSSLFSPRDYFINLLHGTSFNPSQIDVDFSLGNSAVLSLSILSIVVGSVSFAAEKKVINRELSVKKSLEECISGWLPKEPNTPNIKRVVNQASMSKKRKITIIIGASALVICGFLLFSIIMTIVNPIYPTDAKIFNTLNQNKEFLLSIPNVVGAGIARNSSNNYIIGIAVYVTDNATDTSQIPQKMGDFTVIVKRISEASDFEGDRMIIGREGFP